MATETVTLNTKGTDAPAQSQYPREPLQLKGVLDQFKSFDVTPVIGREFVDVNLKDWLEAPNSDELIRDLAITSTLNLASLAKFVFNHQCSLAAWSSLLPQAR
jgi:hypothetical protein